jgi:hypothetical protein
MESTPAGIVLKWPANLRRAVVQSSDDLQHWQILTLPTTSNNGINTASDPMQVLRRFYRLAVE